MIIVTGAAGFIGYNIVNKLNSMGVSDLILLDDKNKYPNPPKFKNIKYLEYRHFNDLKNLKNIDFIFHQGACSDTMEYNIDYMMEINYYYSKKIFNIAKINNSKFIYASSAAVYGLNEDSEELMQNESPLNIYAQSKLLFDKYIMSQDYPAVGLRYFNVYGKGEESKGKMASMVYKMYKEYKEFKKISLFKGEKGYGNGDQKRDFIYIDDIVSVNIFFMNKSFHGVYNVGTGIAKSFNDVASIIFKYHFDKNYNFFYFEMPEHLKNKYQNFTKADIKKLRSTGYNCNFFSLENGVISYLNDLKTSLT